MAVISHQDADRYLAGSIRDYSIFLIFGADQGLVTERRQKLIRSAIGPDGDPTQIVELFGDAIAADPLKLVDEANAINMFGGAVRIALITAGNRSILPALELLAQSPPAHCLVIVEDGELKREAPLRKWIESQPYAASVECRADDGKDIQRLIDASLHAAGISIEPDAREVLGSMLGEDRLSTRSELDKLTLYAQGHKAITIADINEILHDASTLSVDAAIAAIFSGKTVQAVEAVNKALQLGVDINVLAAASLRYALALHKSRADIENGVSFDVSLQNFLRQVYGYNRKAETAFLLKSISLAKAEKAVVALSEIIKATRTQSKLAEERTTRLFLSLTTLIKRD